MDPNEEIELKTSGSDEIRRAQAGPRRAAALLAAIAGLVCLDVIADASTGAELEHLALEAGLMVLAVGGGITFWRTWLGERARILSALTGARREAAAARVDATHARSDADEAARDAARWREEAERWRGEARELLEGLSAAIDVQFERWSLTPAEREVALLLLKGLSHQEVADVRAISERTARKQARAVYQKAGLAGRAELSAFFLEDLL